MYHQIHFSCVSHTGNRRSMNQDNFICDGQYMKPENDTTRFPLAGCVDTRSPALFGVFDGMGGEECGEIASFLAAQKASTLTMGSDIIRELTQFCKDANQVICDYARDHAVEAMGTTAAMLVFAPKEIALCNIGDSRIFRFSNGTLEQISRDHVLISAYGVKPPLSQNLGIPPEELELEPYVAHGKYTNGDIYLICSDGLTDMLTEDEIRAVMANTAFAQITQELLERALAQGGKDNITVIVCCAERVRGWPWKKRRNV